MKILKSKFYNLKSKRGFVSLFAVLISLIVLAMTIGISTVAYKENVLASSAQEGSYAFFAADTGLECALYHDSLGVFMLPGGSMPINPSVECAGQSHLTSTEPGDQTVEFDLEIVMGNPALGQARCAEIYIKKNYDMDPGPDIISATRIYSNGYNKSCSDVAAGTANRLVNRLLIATYPNPVPPPPTTP